MKFFHYLFAVLIAAIASQGVYADTDDDISDHCKDVLVASIVQTQYSDDQKYSLLSLITSSNFSEAKKNGGLSALVPVYGVPVNISGDYQSFSESLSSLSRQLNVSWDKSEKFAYAESHLTADEIDAWTTCMKSHQASLYLKKSEKLEQPKDGTVLVGLKLVWQPADSLGNRKGLSVRGHFLHGSLVWPKAIEKLSLQQAGEPGLTLQSDKDGSIWLQLDAKNENDYVTSIFFRLPPKIVRDPCVSRYEESGSCKMCKGSFDISGVPDQGDTLQAICPQVDASKKYIAMFRTNVMNDVNWSQGQRIHKYNTYLCVDWADDGCHRYLTRQGSWELIKDDPNSVSLTMPPWVYGKADSRADNSLHVSDVVPTGQIELQSPRAQSFSDGTAAFWLHLYRCAVVSDTGEQSKTCSQVPHSRTDWMICAVGDTSCTFDSDVADTK